MRGDFKELMDEFEQQKSNDRIINFWKTWGSWIITFILATLVGTVSWSVYSYYTEKRNLQYSQLFEKGKGYMQDRASDGIKILTKVSESNVPQYKSMAHFALAEYFLANGKLSQANDHFKQIESDRSIKKFDRGLAALNRLRIQAEQNDEKRKALTEIDSLLTQYPELRTMTLELKAHLLFELKEYQSSRNTFIEIAQSTTADPDTRSRAHSMVRLLSIKYMTAIPGDKK